MMLHGALALSRNLYTPRRYIYIYIYEKVTDYTMVRIISKPQRLHDDCGGGCMDSARVKYAFAPRDNASGTLNSQSR